MKTILIDICVLIHYNNEVIYFGRFHDDNFKQFLIVHLSTSIILIFFLGRLIPIHRVGCKVPTIDYK
jgi:hypothetical protein